jgi:hypothetical protein
MRFFVSIIGVFSLLLVSSCQEKTGRTVPASAPVRIEQRGNAAVLLRHGQPYFIRGAGGHTYLDRLKACGGNSIRVWDDLDAGAVLDDAQRRGMTVMLGIWVERETDGFDYNDREAVARQYERVRRTVLKYKNHPALLLWCMGNEWAQDATNFAVFDEVNRLTALVHELDPGHPITTAISPDSGRSIWLVRERCPELDILSVNAYGVMAQLRQFLDEGGWTKPYLISEFGPKGYWEVPLTPWGTPIEPLPQAKTTFVQQTYQQYIGSQPPGCLGAYMFFWGSKQEETHTWFSFLDDRGRESALIGLSQELWTGKRPANQAPAIWAIQTDGKPMSYAVFAPATQHRAHVLTTDPEGDSLTYYWQIKPSAQHTADYTDTSLPALTGLIQSATAAETIVRVPRQPGAYRLFVDVYDTHNHIASANLSFQVK